MSLEPGKTLSFYEILSPLGAGGMGEVYLARDTKLEREVAIKVLPEELAGDAERLRRFEREAKTLASLNHPNVAGIHGVDQVDDTCFLALELVPGEDLAARVARGALPLDEALDVCRQIAEGLEAAHEAGVVHRDLKPANVRITPEGIVKILDFGLAKPMHANDGSGTTTAQSDSFLMTEEGVVLGTPTYMSPEQARGRPVDRRTDIWALGCVLFECLTGTRAFHGTSMPDVFAAIVDREPDWALLPPVPPRVNELLHRTLLKDPRQRLRDAGEARVQLALAQDEPVGPGGGEAVGPDTSHPKRSPLIAALLVGLAFVLGYPLGRLLVGNLFADGTQLSPDASGGGAPLATSPEPLDVLIEVFGGGESLRQLKVSPDGRFVAWVLRGELMVRSLTDRQAVLLHEGRINHICWSPDGKRLAFMDDGILWTIPRAGGQAVRSEASDSLPSNIGSVDWTPQGIVYAGKTQVARVPLDGGEPGVLHSWAEDEMEHLDGMLCLPDDQGLLVVPHSPGTRPDRIVWIHDGEEQLVLQRKDSVVNQLCMAGSGNLVYQEIGKQPGLWTVPLSLEPFKVGKPRLLVAEGADPSAAPNGTLVFTESPGEGESQLTWVDRDGNLAPFGQTHDSILTPQTSPDEGSVVYTRMTGGRSEVWVHELERGLSTKRLQLEGGMSMARFLPDGRLAVITFGEEGTVAYPASGLGEPQPVSNKLLSPTIKQHPRYLFYAVGAPWATEGMVYEDREHPDAGVRPVFEDGEEASLHAISADGKWMLYSTERTGERQLHLTTFPRDPEQDWTVTAEIAAWGGVWFDEPRQRVLFVRGEVEGEKSLWSVSLEFDPEVRLGLPVQVFAIPSGVRLEEFDPDGERWLGTSNEQPERVEVRMLRGWDG